MIGLLFKIILIAIFIYLIYQLFFRRITPGKPFAGPDEPASTEDPGNASLQKKIDMSDVEDADYKEIE